ncbi:DUF1566 domain-containing protein [Thiocapsa rosea]|uniref:Uncharacterized protein DUF1566 n=1 Tax=Thiocapsa rosea TaxID=69360 RepID=A0A495UNX6_9GAMM|nr:DUF1566 domain-containing protein [Thiocapsa rosea]RKT38013.1 uncharacterized protein DUF1566 [Thiocapsa rosea]
MGYINQARIIGFVAAVLLLGAGPVKAALTMQANGTVYDSVQDISWDQDGNAVKTLCDANDPIWQAFDPSAVVNGSGRAKTDICDRDDGRLDWFEAEAWVAHLNAQVYKGITNWRQWTVTQPDPTCSFHSSYTSYGYRCTGSEMGHLFYAAAPDGLENPSMLDFSCPQTCLMNTGQFENFRPSVYWSSTEYANGPALAWSFFASFGYQKDILKGDQGYIWAVRPGQVEPPPGQPEPIPAVGAWGLGLLGLLLMVLARARLR